MNRQPLISTLLRKGTTLWFPGEMRIALKVSPLSWSGLLLKFLPTVTRVSYRFKQWKPGISLDNIHSGLRQFVHKLHLALGDLDDLLDQASANFLLDISDPNSWLASSLALRK
jgi:hypothetical protein